MQVLAPIPLDIKILDYRKLYETNDVQTNTGKLSADTESMQVD